MPVNMGENHGDTKGVSGGKVAASWGEKSSTRVGGSLECMGSSARCVPAHIPDAVHVSPHGLSHLCEIMLQTHLREMGLHLMMVRDTRCLSPGQRV